MPAYKCNQWLFFDTSQLGRITKTHMSFRDLQECGVNPDNGISCTPRSFDRRTGAVRIAVQTLFNPPPVREHGAREAISETSHAAGNTRRPHTYFHLFSLVHLGRRTHDPIVAGCQQLTACRRIQRVSRRQPRWALYPNQFNFGSPIPHTLFLGGRRFKLRRHSD